MVDPFLTKAIYYEYEDETLKIISIDVEEAKYREDNELLQIHGNNLRVGIFPVYPIDLEEGNYESKPESDISFQTLRVGAAVIVTKKKQQLFIPAFFNEGPELEVQFQQGKSFEVIMMVELMNRIRNYSKEAYPNV